MKFLSLALSTLILLSSCGVREPNNIDKIYISSLSHISQNEGKLEGVRIEPTPSAKIKQKKFDAQTFQFNSSGYREGSEHDVFLIKVDTRVREYYGRFKAGKNGELLGSKNTPIFNTSINIIRCTLSPCMLGEPFFLACFPTDGSGGGTISLMEPRPIEFIWEDGARVSAIIRDVSCEVFYIHYEGFESGELIKTQSLTCGESINNEFNCLQDGTNTELYSFACVNSEGAPVAFVVNRTGHKPGILKFFWGKEAKEKHNME